MSDQLRVLARATFSSFFQSELMLQGLPQVRLVIFALVLSMLPALQLTGGALYGYSMAALRRPDVLDLIMWPQKLLFVTFSMVVSSVITLVIWENLFPDRRDAFIVGHLPISRWTLVGGRLLAVVALMLLIGVGAALPSSFLYGTAAGAFSPGGVVRSIVAHFVATVGASAFAFAALIALQAFMLNVLPARWVGRVTLVLQFVFIVAALESLLFMEQMSRALGRVAAAGVWIESPWTQWAPPVWFLGLYEVMAGTRRPLQPLAVRAALALGVFVPAAFGLYALTHQRLMRRALESPDLQRTGSGRVGRFLTSAVGRVLAPAPVSDAVLRFAMRTLAQSRRHRLLLTLFTGAGTTLAGAVIIRRVADRGFHPMEAPAPYLAFGLVLLFFTISGLRTLFQIPSDPPANWIFRLSDAEDPRLHMQGARATMFSAAVLPIVAVLAPAHLYLWGVPLTIAHTIVLLAAGALLCELALAGSRKVPFTCTYAPPLGRARILWPIGLIFFVSQCYRLASIEAAAFARPWTFIALAAGLAGTAFAVGAVRDRWLAGWPLVFIDEEEDSPVILKLSGSTQ